MAETRESLSLQKKVSLTLAVVIAVFTILSFLTLRVVIAPTFENLEQRAARSDLVRVEQALQTDLQNLSAITADWAPWDDIFSYVRDENPGFAKSNLDRPTLENLDLDLMAIYAIGARLKWGQVLKDGEERAIGELMILDPDHPAASKLVRHDSEEGRTLGIIYTGLGPALISSRPILKSDDSGPVSGALVMGQFLDADQLRRIRYRTDAAVSWMFTADKTSGSPMLSSLAAGEQRIEVSDTEITTYKMFADINGEPLLLLQTDTPRQISALGANTVNAALAALVGAGIIVTIAMWVTLRWTILAPLERLASHIGRIRESGDLTHKVENAANDEIGELAQQFNKLTGEVHDARQALLDQSFKAGKADTAAEVLHNIRNAMTPMINGLDRLGRSMNVARKLRVKDALVELENGSGDAERRSSLLKYLGAGFEHVESVNGEALRELDIVAAQARQIEAILADQERFANVAPISENLRIADVVAEASHVIPKNAEPPVKVVADASLSERYVYAHRIGLLQVLGNLILNAFESIQRQQPEHGEIEISARETSLDNKSLISVTVRDNGAGFDDDIGKRIFQRGFSSKSKDTARGLGLHWCANAAAGMGGRIIAESAGAGQGAEFHLLLPPTREIEDEHRRSA